MRQLRIFLKRRSMLGLITVYLLGLVVARQVEVYAGAPEGDADKDCALRADGTPVPDSPVVTARETPVFVKDRNTTINDASCLDRTRVFGLVRAQQEDEIRQALQFAQDEGIHVSIAGRRHSMGGQAFFQDALVLDMQDYNRMSIDEEGGILRVQSGATWEAVLNYLHPRGFSVKAMQAIDVLTVGGSVAVNAHGIDHRSGSIASSIRSVRIMLADGSIHVVSRTTEPELFHAAIGGYGLFGVILEVELSLTGNEMYRFNRRIIATAEFPAIFADEIDGNDKYRLMYLHLSTDPRTLLQEAILYTYETTGFDEPIPPLRETGFARGGRFMLNLAKTGALGEWLKWFGQKHILPYFRQCHVSRNEALRESEACLISRNEALHENLDVLKNILPDDTDILQEYFVPREQILPFLDSMRQVLEDNGAVLLNASVRVVHREDILLNYAPEDMFSVVLYLNQEVSAAGNEKMALVTSQLIDTAIGYGGTFYLPYQLHYSRAQLGRAYPEINAFFALKRAYDPTLTFMNHWYDRYTDGSSSGADPGYLRSDPRLPEQAIGEFVVGANEPEPLNPLHAHSARPRGPPSPDGLSEKKI